MKSIFSKFFMIIAFLIIYNLSFNINNCKSQWVQCNGIGTNQFVYSFTLLGNNIFAGTSQYGVYVSTDNGANWSQTSLNNKFIYSLTIAGNNIIAGSQYATYRSTNNGTSWIQTNLGNYYSVVSLATYGNNVFAGTNGDGIYISTNFGASWNITTISNQYVYSFATLGNYIFAGIGESGVFYSTNNGSNWIQTSFNNHTAQALTTIGNNIFAGTIGYGVYLSTNYGANWTQTTLNDKTVYSLAASENNIFAGIYYISTGSGGVFLSTNNGANWINKNQGFTVIPSVVALLTANNYIFAGTYEHSAWRRTYSEILVINKISKIVPVKCSLKQNYPNPFNPTTTIRYEIPKNSSVKLVIFDVLGREVETLVDEKQTAGTYEATFNASQYSSGVYFYKLTTDNFSETKKMLLIK